MSVTRAPELQPPGDSTVQTIPDFYGAITGHRHTGHLIWLPDALTVSGSTYSYRSGQNYPVLLWRPGQGATPTQSATGSLATIKQAMTDGLIPPMIIVYLNTTDPDDSVEGWGMDSANGSFPFEQMAMLDIPAWLRANTRAAGTPQRTIAAGFSKGGFETLRMRAKYGLMHAAAYVVIGSPRLDADFPTAAATYTSFSVAERTKIFGDSTGVLQAQSPIANSSGVGLFNVYGNNPLSRGAAPLLFIESDDGAGSAGDTTTRNSMNNAATRLSALSITYSPVNVYALFAASKPGHVLSEYMSAWNAVSSSDSNGWRMDLRWIKLAAGL